MPLHYRTIPVTAFIAALFYGLGRLIF